MDRPKLAVHFDPHCGSAASRKRAFVHTAAFFSAAVLHCGTKPTLACAVLNPSNMPDQGFPSARDKAHQVHALPGFEGPLTLQARVQNYSVERDHVALGDRHRISPTAPFGLFLGG